MYKNDAKCKYKRTKRTVFFAKKLKQSFLNFLKNAAKNSKTLKLDYASVLFADVAFLLILINAK